MPKTEKTKKDKKRKPKLIKSAAKKKKAKKEVKLDPLENTKKIKYVEIFKHLSELKEDEFPSVDILKQIVVLTGKELKPLLQHLDVQVSGSKAILLARVCLRKKIKPNDFDAEEFEKRSPFNQNPKLANIFLEQAKLEEGFKANALTKTGTTLKFWPEKITEANQMKGVPGFGKGSLTRIADFLENEGDDDDDDMDDEEKKENEDLQDKIMNVLKDADGEAVSLDDIVKQVESEKDVVESAIKVLENNGSCYSPTNDNNYASAL